MKATRFQALGAIAALGLLFTMGCEQPAGDEAVADGEQAITEPATAEPTADDHHRRGKHGKHGKFGKRGKHGKFGKRGGPDGLLRAALHKLTLSDDQRTTIEGLLGDLKGEDGDKGQAHAAFNEALASGVEAGTISAAVVDTQVASMETHMSAKRAKLHSALNTLHTTLTSEQRSELVTALRARMDKHGPGLADSDDSDDSDDPSAADDDKGPRHGKHGKRGRHGKFGKRGGKFGHLLHQLDLSEDQRGKLKEARKASLGERPDKEAMKAKWAEKRAAMTTMLDTFASDSFDATTLKMAAGKSDMMRKRLQRDVDDLNAALPLLTAEQKTQLAKMLREGPKHPHKRRGRRGHDAPEAK